LKRSQVLAFSVLALMLMAAVPVQQSRASSAYSEKLNVFIAGSSAYWYFTFSGVNGSSKLTQFESSPGLSWYNVTAIRTTTWQSDFQIYGPSGYNLIPVPFITPEGLFLTIGSDSYPDALVAARRLDAYLTASFVSLSNGSSSYEFYSPVSFVTVVPLTLLKLLPSSLGGFAAAISVTGFDNTPSPIVILEGTKVSSGFSHSLVVGSIYNKALDSQNRPNLFAYFGTAIASLNGANRSSSSTIQIRVLDGLMTSASNGVVTNDTSHFTGSYTLSVAPLKKVTRINTTVFQQPLQLLAARYIDVGVLQKNQNMSVTISLTNLSNKSGLSNVAFSDNWWDPSLFRLVGGTSTFSLPNMSASQVITPTYVLQYVGSETKKLTIPTEPVRFTYRIGGSTFQGRSWLNPITISLGRDDPVLFAYVAPNGGIGKPVGAIQSLSLVVKNVGTRAASSVIVAGQQTNGLAADGGAVTVKINQTASGLLGTNVTKRYLVTYSNAQGNKLNATTNLLPISFIHSGMKLGFATAVMNANLAPLKAGSATINLTLSFTVTNAGSANVSSFVAEVPVPGSLGCGVTKGKGISCASNILTLSYAQIGAQVSEQSNMKVNVTNLSNYFIPPLSFHGTTGGINITGRSNAYAVPTGYVLTKQFRPSQLFNGVNSTVILSAVNKGPFYVYNASLSSTVDTFDHVPTSAVLSTTNSSIAPGLNISRSYAVTASNQHGSLPSSPVSSSIFFGGRKFSLQGLGPFVLVYQPLTVTITTVPSSPTEGHDFSLDLIIHNPTTVNVTSVLFMLPIPSGLTLSQVSNNAVLSKDLLSVATPILAAQSNYNATAVAVASSGTTVPFDKAKLTFVYQGVTISGKTPSQGIVIAENATLRYLIPTAVALVVLFAVAFYVRRVATTTVPASQK
jgi:hypothetical protein